MLKEHKGKFSIMGNAKEKNTAGKSIRNFGGEVHFKIGP